MIVYLVIELVTKRIETHRNVVGVFSTEDDANKFIERKRTENTDWAYEWELEEHMMGVRP